MTVDHLLGPLLQFLGTGVAVVEPESPWAAVAWTALSAPVITMRSFAEEKQNGTLRRARSLPLLGGRVRHARTLRHSSAVSCSLRGPVDGGESAVPAALLCTASQR